MQRRAQRDDQRAKHDGEVRGARRMSHAHRVLAAATALPVLLLASACSSDSDSGSGSDAKQDTSASAGASASASPSPTVQAATYRSLPGPCTVLSKKTLTELVPKADADGKAGASDEPGSRAGCSWDSLTNNGVKGSQYRWLNVSLLRFESDVTRGSGDALAQEYYESQVKDAQTVSGAKNTKSAALTGTGDQATSVQYDLKKKEGAFKQQTVVVRVENVVITLDYNGAGLAGDKTPDAATLVKAAQKAAKEAVASVRAANTADTSATPAPTTTKPSSSTPSPSAS